MTAFRMFGSSFLAAGREWRVWLLGYLLVTLTALFLVLPLLQALQAALDHHPGASLSLGESLDLDFARRRPDLALQGGGALLLVLLGWTCLGGGLLATAAERPRPSFVEFLAACGRTFWPSLRVLAVGLLLALLLAFGVASLDAWLRLDVLADADPGAGIAPFGLQWRIFTLAFGLELLRWCYGLCFLLLLFAAKVARAHLAAGRRRSAWLAFVAAAGNLLRHPLRSLLLLLQLLAAWIAAGWLLGMAVDQAEAGGRLWWMLAASQLHVILLQILLATAFLMARAGAGLDAVETAPPVIELPAESGEGEPPPDEPLPA